MEENAARAKQLVLKQIGNTDHGFSNHAFGLKRKKVPDLIADCKRASEKLGIDVLVGMESNIRGISGLTDLTEEDYDDFDLFICGKHVFIVYETFSDWLHYFGGNFTVDKFGRRTYIELNSKKAHLTDEELFAVCETGVRFVVDSDAHSVDRVGDTKLVEEQLARVCLPPERIDNIDGRLPKFRFAEFKRHR